MQNLNKNFTFLIPTRKNSKRVINKNTRKFHNTNLLGIKLKQLRRVFNNCNILLSTDCAKSIKIAKKYNTKINLRPKKFTSNSIPMKEVYKYFASLVQTKYLCYLNVTSPLLSDSSLINAIKFFIKNKKKYDSLTTIHIIQEYMWYNKKALNYNPNNHPRSQDLIKIQGLNFAFSIVKTKFMETNGKIFTKNFFPFELIFPEFIDIDEKKDFMIAEYIYKNKKKFFI